MRKEEITPERDLNLVRGELADLLSLALEAKQMGEGCTEGLGKVAAEKCTRIWREHRDTLRSEGERHLLEEVLWAIRKGI